MTAGVRWEYACSCAAKRFREQRGVHGCRVVRFTDAHGSELLHARVRLHRHTDTWTDEDWEQVGSEVLDFFEPLATETGAGYVQAFVWGRLDPGSRSFLRQLSGVAAA